MIVIVIKPEMVTVSEEIDLQGEPKVRVEEVDFGRKVTSKKNIRNREHINTTFARGGEFGAS
jgi:hypothetical protein